MDEWRFEKRVDADGERRYVLANRTGTTLQLGMANDILSYHYRKLDIDIRFIVDHWRDALARDDIPEPIERVQTLSGATLYSRKPTPAEGSSILTGMLSAMTSGACPVFPPVPDRIVVSSHVKKRLGL